MINNSGQTRLGRETVFEVGHFKTPFFKVEKSMRLLICYLIHLEGCIRTGKLKMQE